MLSAPSSSTRPTKSLPKNPTLIPVPATTPKTPAQKENARRLIVVLESACLEVYRLSAGSGGRDGKGGKDAKYALLNCDDHQGILAKTGRDIADARPDITHQVSTQHISHTSSHISQSAAVGRELELDLKGGGADGGHTSSRRRPSFQCDRPPRLSVQQRLRADAHDLSLLLPRLNSVCSRCSTRRSTRLADCRCTSTPPRVSSSRSTPTSESRGRSSDSQGSWVRPRLQQSISVSQSGHSQRVYRFERPSTTRADPDENHSD